MIVVVISGREDRDGEAVMQDKLYFIVQVFFIMILINAYIAHIIF